MKQVETSVFGLFLGFGLVATFYCFIVRGLVFAQQVMSFCFLKMACRKHVLILVDSVDQKESSISTTTTYSPDSTTTSLNLSHHPIPLTCIEFSSSFHHLTTLYLQKNKLTQLPDSLFELTSLLELNVSYNELQGSLNPKLGNLINLKELNASHNTLTGIPVHSILIIAIHSILQELGCTRPNLCKSCLTIECIRMASSRIKSSRQVTCILGLS